MLRSKQLVEFGNYLFSKERKELLEESGKELLEERFSKISDADVSNFLSKIPEQTTDLTFGQAVEALKLGKKVARSGWNGSGMFAYLVPASSFPALTGVAKQYFGENSMVPYRAYMALKTAQNDVATWAPSGSDVLAEDWVIVE